jgi:hypothetical protein
MLSHNSNADVLFDRLVDGELSPNERRALLASLDARPDGWRRCALAFLEAQWWKNVLTAVTAEPATTSGIEKDAAPSNPAQRTRFRVAASWLAMAAGLLIAFKLGTLDRRATKQVVDGAATTQQQLAGAPHTGASNAAGPGSSSTGDSLNLWVHDEAGQLQRVRVPLVDASTLGNEYGLDIDSGVPDNVRNRLQNHGYAVESKRQYAPMWLDNGRQMIVPVEDTKIVPVSNKVY